MDREKKHSPQAATQRMAAEISRLSLEAGPDGERLTRIEIALETGLTPLEWLRAQDGWTQYYWADRQGDFEMAGVGEADVLVPAEDYDLDGLFDGMRRRLSPFVPSLRFYGGFRFHRGPVRGARWQNFAEYRFVVPRFEVLRREGGTWLVCNIDREASGPADELLDKLSAIRFPEDAPPIHLPRGTRRVDQPDAAEWRHLVLNALGSIEAGDFEKVVLARESLFTADAPLDAVSILSALLQQTMRSYEFCFHPAEDRAFIGASPERLFKRNNCYIESEALAGTRPRGKSDEDDHRLGEALLLDEKEQREHGCVVRRLEEILGDFCREVRVKEGPRLKRLRTVQHLHTPIEGILKRNEVDGALIEALHPTPAVGGSPREDALAWIEKHEPFDRGIYASPVGWVSFDQAEFCVAIRSGLVVGNEIALYSGAGLVAGSNPTEEWEEVEAKMKGFLNVVS